MQSTFNLALRGCLCKKARQHTLVGVATNRLFMVGIRSSDGIWLERRCFQRQATDGAVHVFLFNPLVTILALSHSILLVDIDFVPVGHNRVVKRVAGDSQSQRDFLDSTDCFPIAVEVDWDFLRGNEFLGSALDRALCFSQFHFDCGFAGSAEVNQFALCGYLINCHTPGGQTLIRLRG